VGPAVVALTIVQIQMGVAIPVAMEVVAITAHPIQVQMEVAPAMEALAQILLTAGILRETVLGL